MAIVCVPVNGIGYGHLVRSATVARWLRRAGDRPVIFHQGKYPPEIAQRIPGISMLPLYRLPTETLQFAVEQIASYARLTSPAIVIEDTHPLPATWPGDLSRVLLLRPTTFEFLEELRALPQPYDAVVLCDHPLSPTWPYTEAQTQQIQAWPGWHIVGPIFRRAQPSAIAAAARKYAADDGGPLIVFSMGAGGELAGAGDRQHFIATSAALAERIRARQPASRLVFVRGPLFPEQVELPPIFEDVRVEPDMPALLAAAHAAVVRPGFNVTWECLAGQTPFVPIAGTTFAEPVPDRLRTLRERGIGFGDDPDAWWDAGWMEQVRAQCRAMTSRFDGAPRAVVVAAVRGSANSKSKTVVATQGGSEDPPRREQGRRRWFSGAFQRSSAKLLIRIDDIVTVDDTLRWVSGACGERGVPLSLEVIPYHATLRGGDLDAIDCDGLLQVSQHGSAHLPSGLPGRVRGEFYADRREASPISRQWLRRGERLLRRRFGARFTGGYSAPYDTWPPWLPAEWRDAGGRFLSWMNVDPTQGVLPGVRLAVDPWDWQRRDHRSEDDLVSTVRATLDVGDVTGIVLHPQCLATSAHRSAFEDLLDAMLECGCVPASAAGTALEG